MKKQLFSPWALMFLLSTLAVGVGVVLAKPQSQNNQVPLMGQLAQQMSRACVFPVDGWTIVDCSNAVAATSAALNQWSRYVVQCGDDSYIATGDAATDVADANDGWVPNGAWLEFATTDSVLYISCLNKNSDSDCRYWECR